MKNLLTYLYYKYGDEIYSYFTEEARQELQGDKWDENTNSIVCTTDAFMEEEDEEDSGLDGAQQFLKEQKKK